MALAIVSAEKKQIVKNLYLSGIGEEFIALQLDLEIPVVIDTLQGQGVYEAEPSKSAWKRLSTSLFQQPR